VDELLLNLFPGLAAMANWHPVLVHFPIALLSSYFLLDLAGAIARKPGWRDAAGIMLYLGTLSAAAAVALGLHAAATVAHSDAVHDIMMEHRDHGLVVLGTALLLSLWRCWRGKRWSAWGSSLHLLLAGAMVANMLHGADMGGLMVYGYGVGMSGKPQAQDGHSHSHSHDHGAGDHHH
jgi:uncharacterized membrane protein